MKSAIFKEAKTERGFFAGTTKNTAISQREKLEEAMLNLATALGERYVVRASTQTGYQYRVGNEPFQRASNRFSRYRGA